MNTAPNVLQMQREAAARVKQMEERSRRLVREHPVNLYRGVTLAPLMKEQQPPPKTVDATAQAAPSCSPPETAPPCEPPKSTSCGELSGLFGGDNECLFLLLLVIVLAKNGAPMELLLALLYIAL
jgi:hypothetical protein